MSYDDFCRLTPEEFEAVSSAFHDQQESRSHAEWERMRLLATIIIQPHLKKKITPHGLLPFAWDNKRKSAETPILSKEESRKKFLELMARQKSDKKTDRDAEGRTI